MTFIKITVDDKDFQKLRDDVTDFPEDILRNLDDITQRMMALRIERVAKTRLSEYPPPWPKKQKFFRWSGIGYKDDKARKWWFANAPKDRDPDGTYKRTGKTGRAWTATTSYKPTTGGATITASIINPTDGASYVYGYEPDNWKRVPSHRITGWLSAGNSPQMNATIEDTLQIMLDEINTAVREAEL